MAGQPTATPAPRQTLRVLLQDPAQPLRVTLCYRLTPAQDIIERWLELENAGPTQPARHRTVRLCHAAPAGFCILHGRPRSEARNQLLLDFGRPEIIEYIYEALDRLLAEYPIEFIKWDTNRYASGYELMTLGLPGDASQGSGYSHTLHLKQL